LKTFRHSFVVDVPIDKVWEFYTNLQHLSIITPKEMDFKIIESNSDQITQGQTACLSSRLLTRITWKTKITSCKPYTYVDEMSEGLFKHWKHTHVFQKIIENQTRVIDEIEFELPFRYIGKLFERYAQDRLEKIFAYRKRATIKALNNSLDWKSYHTESCKTHYNLRIEKSYCRSVSFCLALSSFDFCWATAFLVLSRYAIVVPRFPNPIELSDSDGIMTIVFP